MNKRTIVISVTLAIFIAGSALVYFKKPTNNSVQPPTQPSSPDFLESKKIIIGMQEILAAYRKTIVLLADQKTMKPDELASAEKIGQALFHENLDHIAKVHDSLDALVKSTSPSRFAEIENILNYVESGEGLYDADRLAFKEIIYSLQRTVAADQTLPAIKLHKRISEDRDALVEIEKNYEKEIRQIFGRFDQRAIELKRERWDDYVAHLNKLYTREKILKDYGVIVPYPPVPESKEPSKEEKEIFGYDLPPKTIALTFDDGPHRVYTEEIEAILKQYDIPAAFFQVGKNLGTVNAEGKEKLGANSAASRKLVANGYALGNHSFSHALLSKETGDALNDEIVRTDILLKALDPKRAPLFRFPYGAHNKEGMELLSKLGLKSIKWNIDSLDWADPIPSSIADRVLRSIDKERRGIVLFHDIHERTVKALPLILDRLVADGYQFAAWNGENFVSVTKPKGAEEKAPITATAYQNSWAVVIGIDNYAKWPILQYAVRDAQSISDTLVSRFGFPTDHVFTITNEEATRNNILTLFHDRLGDSQLKRDDRVFVFFAGHGATVKLSSGRNLGYIIPADSDPQRISADAIPMTELQNIAESIKAKHVLFVMDACYSGLGLTRGGSSQFLKENARRVGRQMLTAGGADQLVADGGPNGHSVFTWTLLQALNGKADLNGDGLITGTELAAFVAPAVSSVSQQTPAFGSLPGSEGGEFVFELPTETEFLNAQTNQLSYDAIALNNKIEESRPASAEEPIVLKNLQGKEQKIAPPQPVKASARQLAQRANDRGLQLYREKQYDQAEAAFTEALKHKADFALAANNLGFVYYKQEKYVEAARWFENTIQIDPSRAVAYVNLGDAYFHLKEMEKAKKSYKTYLELAPNGASTAYAKEQLARIN